MHPSSLTKFRKLRLNQEDILEDLLGEVINQAIQKNLIPSKTLILDATHTRSQYQVKTPIENLREVSKNIRKQLYRYVPEVKIMFLQSFIPLLHLKKRSFILKN